MIEENWKYVLHLWLFYTSARPIHGTGVLFSGSPSICACVGGQANVLSDRLAVDSWLCSCSVNGR